MMRIGAEIKSFIERCKLVYVGTSDKTGTVHLAIAREMKVPDSKHVVFEEWFCHKTLENLDVNPQITIGVVDTLTGKGYQLIGEVEEINMGAIMDGFVPDKEEKWSRYPQSRHQIYARVDGILELDTGPHSDEEIE